MEHILFHEHTAQKLKFSIKDFFSKCDQIRAVMIVDGRFYLAYFYRVEDILETNLFVEIS